MWGRRPAKFRDNGPAPRLRLHRVYGWLSRPSKAFRGRGSSVPSYRSATVSDLHGIPRYGRQGTTQRGKSQGRVCLNLADCMAALARRDFQVMLVS